MDLIFKWAMLLFKFVIAALWAIVVFTGIMMRYNERKINGHLA